MPISIFRGAFVTNDENPSGDVTDPLDEGAAEAAAPVRPLITATMIAAVDLAEMLAPVADQDEHAVETRLYAVAREAREAGADTRADTLELLAGIMTIAVRPDDENNPFGPKIVLEGRRSMIPDDIVGEQSSILANLVDTLPNVHLRAKIGDLAFYNSRKHWKAAATAITAYCAIARGRLDNTITPRWPERAESILDVVSPLARATALSGLTRKRGDVSADLTDTLRACYDAALTGRHYVAFVKIAELGLHYKILEFATVADDAETLADASPADTYPEALKRVLLVAASCHDRLGRNDDAARCGMAAAEQTLKMRDQSDQPTVKAHWTKAAIGELRSIPGSRERVQTLRDELRLLQMSANDDFGTFHTPIDLADDQKVIAEHFAGIDFAEACIQFCMMAEPASKQDLRTIALELAEQHPLGASIGASYYDAEGREMARVPPLTMGEEPSDDWYRAEAVRHMDIAMFQQVRGKIEPARIAIADRISIQERHLLPIAEASAFVPQGRDALFAMGFARMFQGDYASAAHFLFPQLENSLRHILMISNRDPSKIEQDLIQGDRTLSALLDVNRTDLEAILGEDVVHEIDILFNFRPGPALRNEFAHGKLPWGAFFHHATIFGCWFIFNLTCRPLFRVWREQIAPRLREETIDLA